MKSALLLVALGVAAHAQTILVKPYVQPGDGAALTGTDVKVLTWLTDQKPGEFTVEFGVAGQPVREEKPVRLVLDFEPRKSKPAAKPPAPATKLPPAATGGEPKVVAPVSREAEQHYFRYRTELTGLPFDSEISYRVKLGTTVVREGAFRTRASATKPIRFVAVGDLASARPEQNAIAFQIAKQKPELLLALGDIVYPGGRTLEYMHHYWTTYNDVATPGETTGAPLMASVPFYPIIGNHDADSSKLPDYPDAFAAFYFFSVPKNGPSPAVCATPLGSDPQVAQAFRTRAGAEYPALNAYSFDCGPAHFVSIDSNRYVNPVNLAAWLEKDLTASKQPWKFVCFHAPAFHSSPQHGTEQKMRLLEPVFEKCGVDVVFAGHVHNYQRSKPLRFKPDAKQAATGSLVNGTFTFDTAFDGVSKTAADGIIHIVSGGGGAALYKLDEKKTGTAKPAAAPKLQPFTEKFNADVHSFSVVDLTPTTFEMRQFSIKGEELDHFKITK